MVTQEFWLFPAVAHRHAERVLPEYQDLLAAAAADSADAHLVVRVAVKVVVALVVQCPESLSVIKDLHIGPPSRCVLTGSVFDSSTN